MHELSLVLIVEVLNEDLLPFSALIFHTSYMVCVFFLSFVLFLLFFVWIPLQNTSVASPTSRMPIPLSAKSRQSPGTTDKAGKQQKLQDAQRQFRQVVLL